MKSLSLALLPLVLATAPFVVAQAAANQCPFAGLYVGCVVQEYSYVDNNGVTQTYTLGYLLAVKIGKNGHLWGDYGQCYNGTSTINPDASVGGTVSDDGNMTVEVSFAYHIVCDPYYHCGPRLSKSQFTIEAHVELDGEGNLLVTTTGGTSVWPVGDSGVLYRA